MEKKEPEYKDWVGKKINLLLASSRRPIICKIMEVSPGGRATKFKAYRRREALGKLGFIQEGDQWVIQDWQVCRN